MCRSKRVSSSVTLLQQNKSHRSENDPTEVVGFFLSVRS